MEGAIRCAMATKFCHCIPSKEACGHFVKKVHLCAMPSSTVAPLSSPPVLGLTGGIAAGKSMVARALAACGAAVWDADAAAKAVYTTDAKLRERMVLRWGKDVGRFNHEGILVDIERQRLADIVFRSKDELAWLAKLASNPMPTTASKPSCPHRTQQGMLRQEALCSWQFPKGKCLPRQHMCLCSWLCLW